MTRLLFSLRADLPKAEEQMQVNRFIRTGEKRQRERQGQRKRERDRDRERETERDRERERERERERGQQANISEYMYVSWCTFPTSSRTNRVHPKSQ